MTFDVSVAIVESPSDSLGGLVTLFLDGTPHQIGPVWQNRVPYTAIGLTAGDHRVSATFDPGTDGLHLASTSAPFTQVVERIPTQTALAVTRTPPGYGLTASVTASGSGSPSGSVTFRDGGWVLASVPLSQGTATLTAKLTGRQHSLVAEYTGDATFKPSSSPPVVPKP